MKTQETTLQTKDGLSLFAQIWEPEDAPQGVVCLVHGIGEHIGRYQHVAEAFTQAGFTFIGYDQRGHGKSPGKRGHTPSYAAMLDDIDSLLALAQRQNPEIPCFLYGHSMGGGEVINYILRRNPQIAGAVATSPWLKTTDEQPALKMLVAKIANQLAPSFTLPNDLDLSGLSRDPEVAVVYQADPLVHNQVSARLGYEGMQAGLWNLENAGKLALPLLLAHGDQDRLTSVQASRDFAARAGENCTLKIWEGMYHETHNEPEREQILAFYIDWIKQLVRE